MGNFIFYINVRLEKVSVRKYFKICLENVEGKFFPLVEKEKERKKVIKYHFHFQREN